MSGSDMKISVTGGLCKFSGEPRLINNSITDNLFGDDL